MGAGGGGPMKELILGGVRSGKSRLAEQRARSTGLEVVYVATAVAAGDAELEERIRQHRLRRPAEWTLVEEPLALGRTLRVHARAERCLIVECLTLWLTNLLCTAPERLEPERLSLLETLPALAGVIILVSNETGLGVVPQGELSRRFVDLSGELHQRLAAMCDRVSLTVAGLPHLLKGTHP
jgi:adenosylcobinamide kinase / adenosylcobinamide-phosphate guanylyltransferase